MQCDATDIPLGSPRLPCPPNSSSMMWLEEEDPREIEEIERLKRRQKELERELSEKRRVQQERNGQGARPS
jgi:hypothetical protein